MDVCQLFFRSHPHSSCPPDHWILETNSIYKQNILTGKAFLLSDHAKLSSWVGAKLIYDSIVNLSLTVVCVDNKIDILYELNTVDAPHRLCVGGWLQTLSTNVSKTSRKERRQYYRMSIEVRGWSLMKTTNALAMSIDYLVNNERSNWLRDNRVI